MAVPWLRLIDVALGVTDVVRRARGRQPASAAADPEEALATRGGAFGALEAKLAGVVVSALREAFDRDHQRMELERAHIEAERQRAERAQRLELLRQAGEREMARSRMVMGVALASWLGTLIIASRLLTATAGRITLGLGWLCLLLALAAAFVEQGRLSRALAQADDRTPVDQITTASRAGAAAPWLIVAGLAASAIGVLIS